MKDYLYILKWDNKPFIDTLPFLLEPGSSFYFINWKWRVIELDFNWKHYIDDDYEDIELAVICIREEVGDYKKLTRDYKIKKLLD